MSALKNVSQECSYVDKHEEELREAIEKGSFIPSDTRWRVPYMRFLGTVESKYGNLHYYYDNINNQYYYESDFDKEMRIKLRNSRFQKYAKR